MCVGFTSVTARREPLVVSGVQTAWATRALVVGFDCGASTNFSHLDLRIQVHRSSFCLGLYCGFRRCCRGQVLHTARPVSREPPALPRLAAQTSVLHLGGPLGTIFWPRRRWTQRVDLGTWTSTSSCSMRDGLWQLAKCLVSKIALGQCVHSECFSVFLPWLGVQGCCFIAYFLSFLGRFGDVGRNERLLRAPGTSASRLGSTVRVRFLLPILPAHTKRPTLCQAWVK